MKLTGRRESSNVDDRRGSKGKAAGGIGIVGVIIAMLVVYLQGGNPLRVLSDSSVVSSVSASSSSSEDYQPTAEEEQMATLCRQILASTEDVWAKKFAEVGLDYEPPTLVLFTGSVQSACGGATSAVGPFYCSGDKKLYIDLSFLLSMKQSLGVKASHGSDLFELAYAYVVAHEVGHHVQNLLGTLPKVHQKMAQLSDAKANQLSVRLELQADYLAGVWAAGENSMYHSFEEGDIDDAISTALVIGDDYLQKKAQGHAVPESFTHGTAKQRARYLRAGIEGGSIKGAEVLFQKSYADL
ncbi:MAG: neutral zinc metallopeptidase [Marinilabiliaceae bacterium]